ncbi:putative protease [Lachnospiraceae bacterium XBB1006]|nr:putative protease [Lachnospiraceae bacterium XBB1006]
MKHELLAPAGNLSIFYAVINAGADAVYVGGPRFGARAYAKNFTTEELVEAITYAHLQNVKVYMTVNTLIKESELDDCIAMMVPFYEAGLDGVILQDMGVLHAFRSHFPGMELHASTQMSVSNVDGAKMLKEAGIVRIVPSRELSLEEIQRIHKEAEIEIESFIHGALCYCYSGQCLMSSFIGGRSGNRGRCAQPCRLPYEVMDQAFKRIRPSSPILSLKDLCTIHFLPELLDAGIYSLKIEGRMKQASYAYTVVSIYRKYLDYYEQYGAKGYQVSKEDYDALLAAGNRDGFTDGYYHRHNGQEMLTKTSSAHASSEGTRKEDSLSTKKKVAIEGVCTLLCNEAATLSVRACGCTATVTGAVVQAANKKGLLEEQINKQLMKTGESDYEWKSLSIKMDDRIFLPVSVLNQLRREAFAKITELLTVRRRYEKPLTSTVMAPSLPMENQRVSILVRTCSQLRIALSKDYVKRIYVELTTFTKEEEPMLHTLMKEGFERGVEMYCAMPYIFRKKNADAFEKQWQSFRDVTTGLLARSYDGLAYGCRQSVPVIADASLYCMNTLAKLQLKQFHAEEITLSVELRKQEMKPLFAADAECILYGRIPMMITAGCVNKNTKQCQEKPGFLYLKDRKGYVFPVRNECRGCYNIVYNSTPTCLFAKGKEFSGNHAVRLQFSVEEDAQMKQVLSVFEQNVLGRPGTEKIEHFTWGHFKRGVE